MINYEAEEIEWPVLLFLCFIERGKEMPCVQVLFRGHQVLLTNYGEVQLLLRKASQLEKARKISWYEVSMTSKHVCVIKGCYVGRVYMLLGEIYRGIQFLQRG